MLTDSQLQQIMPTLSPQKRQMYLPFLNAIMPQYDITSPLRQAAFLAQIAHESGELKFWEEIWGPTAAQKRYEPPSDLATRLGNTQPGDGKRYKGRGPIQITGRFNYRKYGQLLGLDLEGNPDLASTTQVGFETACQFWKMNGLNELADIPNFTAITKKINGGLNGQADREKYYARAKQALGVAASFSSFSFAVAAEAPSRNEPTKNALPRGQEAIEELANTSDSSGSGSTKAASKKKSAPKLAKKVTRVGIKAAIKKTAKPAAKKATVKKAAKKAAKKPAVKQVPKPATKKAAKKAPAKKAAKKATPKPMKKAAKKPVKKSAKKK